MKADDGNTLARACAVQDRASLVGFDWADPKGALEKVREETREVAELIGVARDGDAAGDGDAARDGDARSTLEEEVGDLFFAVVNLARLADVDPDAALSMATRKFEERFAEVERLARERGLPMPGTTLERLDRLWDEVKAATAGQH